MTTAPKICPECNEQFPPDANICPNDGVELQSNGQPRHHPTDDIIGRTFFGEYNVVQKLGEGGMGAVYLAQQKAIDQHIAIKVLHARAAESEEIVRRFHREAKVISMLSHPNIVRVLIFGRTDDDLLCLAMEYVDGMPLSRVTGQKLDELRVIKIAKQMCSAVYEAHELGIIHRDLKPDNILLTNFRGDENFVKVLDFGIAKLLETEEAAEGTRLTKAGIVYGSPHYMSPEQAQAIDLDHRTDIYAMGCILHEMMTGEPPFVADTPSDLLRQQVDKQSPRLRQVAPDRSSDTMQAIIDTAMAKQPDDRFSSGLDMFEALVKREREILSERGADASATYFPGSELTGLHSTAGAESKLDLDRKKEADDARQDMTGDPKVMLGVIGVLVFIIFILVTTIIAMAVA